MLFGNPEQVVDGIYQSLDDNQGLIEVRTGPVGCAIRTTPGTRAASS